jgi:hypothetical protein
MKCFRCMSLPANIFRCTCTLLSFSNKTSLSLFLIKFLFRWGTTDRTVGDNSSSPISNNTGPYVRRRSAAGTNESNPSTPATLVSVATSLSPPSSVPTTNVTVTNSLDDSSGGKRRPNLPPNRDDEAEAQRKHRSAQARRERRSTQSVTVEDIKAAEQQIKNQPNESSVSISNLNELSNNKIGAPSTPSTTNEHDIETERLQRVIEDKKEKARRTSGGNEVKEKQSSNYLLIFNRK